MKPKKIEELKYIPKGPYEGEPDFDNPSLKTLVEKINEIIKSINQTKV